MSLPDLPAGVEAFNLDDARAQAARNFIMLVYGGPKTGKTDFWNGALRPLYVVYLDTNPNLDTHLIKSSPAHGDEVYRLVIPPKKYSEVTEAWVADVLERIDQFAEWAKANAAERVARGEHGGTFVLDGATYLKGYLEKFWLGESATLGYRPKKGERSSISTYDYAKSNGAFFDFLAGFTRQALDAVFVFEGRPIWADSMSGGKVKTDKWRTTRPDRLPYAVNAEIETMKILERANPADNKSPMLSKFAIRTVYNSENPGLDHLVLPANDHALQFQKYKELLLAETVGMDVLQGAKHVSEVIQAGNTGLPGFSEEEEPDDSDD